MDDNEKIRLIADFEGVFKDEQGRPVGTELSLDYATDLNTTMRAARRLPRGYFLQVTSDGCAWLMRDHTTILGTKEPDDPARAGFKCLYEWISSQRSKPQEKVR